MIKTLKNVPDIYSVESRDFQVLGRTFDVIFNSILTDSEIINHSPLSDNSDERLIDLLTLTLGFKSRHKYNVKQLTALCSTLMKVLRWKGTVPGIKLAVNTLLGAEGISDSATVEPPNELNDQTLVIYLPLDLQDTNLLNDLLSYILPAGVKCEIIQQLAKETKADTTIVPQSNIWKDKKLAAETSVVYKNSDDPNASIVELPSRAEPGLIDNSTVVGQKIKEEE